MERTHDLPHHVIIEGRSRATVSGVEDVESFDENGVTMVTSRGTLVLTGSGLRVDRLSIDKGEINVEGQVDAIEYLGDTERRGFLSRLFG
ncbi:MAG: YabP/YqfC family sporulation protein [Oscillospiraceae bacterium]|nr:YabP/YqfC family sporulation protein [Oscillospiraceae bacterium]